MNQTKTVKLQDHVVPSIKLEYWLKNI